MDTEANIFVLTSWTEDRDTYWTPAPSALPIIMPAPDNTGMPYDVPNDFAILGIGATWAFVGPDVWVILSGTKRSRDGAALDFGQLGERRWHQPIKGFSWIILAMSTWAELSLEAASSATKAGSIRCPSQSQRFPCS